MSSRTLRNRKSIKLIGQNECTSCHRFYFPSENSDDENDDGVQTKTVEALCCDCEEKKRSEPPPKRRAIQRQNGVPSPMSKVIKQEKLDSDDLQSNISGNYGRFSSNANQNTTNGINNFNCDRMVQIHSSELLTQPMLPLNMNSEY